MTNITAIAGVVVKELLRRKDFYVLFIVTALLTALMGSVNFFNDDKIVRYLKEICLLLIWISTLVIAIATAARQLPSEKENRTIFPLLAKPIRRSEIVLGKFLGCWLACGVTLLCFYAFFGIVSMAREHQWPLTNYFQAVWLHWMMLGVVLAMTILGSIIFAAVSSNSTIIFTVIAAILILGRHLHKVAIQLSEPTRTILEVIYFALPHLEFFDVRDLIIHNWPAIRWSVCGAATLYAMAYAALFLFLACLAFRRKALN
jgi:Cu-processing system permease protein